MPDDFKTRLKAAAKNTLAQATSLLSGEAEFQALKGAVDGAVAGVKRLTGSRDEVRNDIKPMRKLSPLPLPDTKPLVRVEKVRRRITARPITRGR